MPTSSDVVRTRPPEPSDAAAITAFFNDWDVARWLSSPPFPYALADAESWLEAMTASIAAGTARTVAITVEGQLAGMCAIEPNARGQNLGFWLGRPYWGRGIMTAVASELVAAHFSESCAGDIVSGYFEGNLASAAIQRRLGFLTVSEGEMPNRAQGRNVPHTFTALSRERFRPRSA
jgi:RimJ/RimL family protein N-acetyltransferase